MVPASFELTEVIATAISHLAVPDCWNFLQTRFQFDGSTVERTSCHEVFVSSLANKMVHESGEVIWQDLMDGNARFVAGKPRSRDLIELRRSLVEAQFPRAIVLACSDSRVSPEIIFDQGLGTLFVIRSAGNVEDKVAVGSIEYAVEHLGISVLVVLGHSRCGAVTAACLYRRMASKCLQSVVDKIRPAVRHVAVGARHEALLDAAIKENVHQSAVDVLSESEALYELAEHGILTVIEAEYILETGCVVRLSRSTEFVGDKSKQVA